MKNEKRAALGLRPPPELEGKRYMSLNWIDANNVGQYQVGGINVDQENSLEKKLDGVRTAVWQYIRENLLMIDILKSKEKTHETIEKIFDLYEISLRLAIQYHVRAPLFDLAASYLNFLGKQREYNRYVEVMEAVRVYIKSFAFDNPGCRENYIAICNECGGLYEALSTCLDPKYKKLADVCFDEVAKANKIT